MQQKILKTGNSLAVTIPSGFVKILGLKPGDEVKVKSDQAGGRLTIFFHGSGQLTLLPKK
jgi:antitoxin component of MazEF toxin-antitoxin module